MEDCSSAAVLPNTDKTVTVATVVETLERALSRGDNTLGDDSKKVVYVMCFIGEECNGLSKETSVPGFASWPQADIEVVWHVLTSMMKK